MLGGHAMTAITAITAQNTLGVSGVWPLPAEAVIAQIDAVAGDLGVDAVKIGMIGSAEVAHAVAERLERGDLAGIPIVFDPVMIATSGARLADADTIAAFGALLRRASVSTPNLDELGALSGMPVSNEIEIGDAAAYLIEQQGSGAILATGAKMVGGSIQWQEAGVWRSASTDDMLFDLLFAQESGWQERVWNSQRIDTTHDHGTGCTLASGIATGLGAGLRLAEAISRARDYVRAALLAAPGYGAGHGPMGHALGVAPFDVVG